MTNDIVPETPDLNEFWVSFKDDKAFDAEAFRQLYEDTNEETVLRILYRLVESLTEGADKILAACTTRDCETIWRYCHKLAGSTELLGFAAYGKLAREINCQLRANPDFIPQQDEITAFAGQTQDLAKRISSACPNLSRYF